MIKAKRETGTDKSIVFMIMVDTYAGGKNNVIA